MLNKKGPYQKKGRTNYYVLVRDGKKFREVSLRTSVASEARAKWHEMQVHNADVTFNTQVSTLLTQFLDHCKRYRAKATHEQYKMAVDSFQAWLALNARGLKVSDLRRGHVLDWAEERWPMPPYARDTVRAMIAGIQRAFNWAVERDMIPYSPVALVRKPGKVQRNACLLPGQWEVLIAAVPPGSFRDLLVALRFTGARPQEVRQVSAAHLFLDHDPPFWTLEPERVKGGQKARITPLVKPVVEICRRLVAEWPEGPIFRTGKGKPWSKDAVHSRLWRLEKKLKFPVCAYSLRHTFATHAQRNSATATSVAVVLGHSPRMSESQYQHLALYSEHLMETMRRATDGVAY